MTGGLHPFGREPAAGVTDKAVLGYLPSYFRIAAELGPEARVLELGVQGGLSIWLWTALFPFGEVVGVDLGPYPEFGPYPESLAPHATSPGWRFIQADAADPGLPALLGDELFNLVVDDASHDGFQTRKSFDMLWPLVAPGGRYVIEDTFTGLPDFPGEGAAPEMMGFIRELPLLLDNRKHDVASVMLTPGLAVVCKTR